MAAYNISHRKTKRKKLPWYCSKVVLIILIILLLLIAKGVWGVYRKASHGKEMRTIAETEYQLLEEKEDFLEARLQRLKTQTGQEEQIREKFNVSKFNEKLVVIVDREVPATTTAAEVSGIQAFFSGLMFWK